MFEKPDDRDLERDLEIAKMSTLTASDEAWQVAKEHLDSFQELMDTGSPENEAEEEVLRHACLLVVGEIMYRQNLQEKTDEELGKLD